MARFLILMLIFPLWGCGETAVTMAPPGGGGTGGGTGGGGTGGGGTGGGSLACAMTGCEIAKLDETGSMPTGSATYLGRASVAGTDSAGEVVTTNAVLQVNANFTSNSLTLQMSDFTDGTTDYTGTAQGSATLTGAQFAGNYAGNLNSSLGISPISGRVTGQFRGADAIALDGDMVASGWGGADAFGRFFANKQ
jgi:hypothetical protein